MPKRPIGGMVVLLVLGCAPTLRSYEGPPPSTSEPAQLLLLYSDTPEPGEAPPSLVVHIHAMEPGCAEPGSIERSYLGTVDFSYFGRTVRVPSESYLLIRVGFRAFEGELASVSCSVSAGFVPAPGGRYTMDFSAFSSRACVVSVQDHEGGRVALSYPRGC